MADDQLARFDRDGVLKLDGLLDRASVALARQAVLRPLEALGLYTDGEWRLDGRSSPKWPASGLKAGRHVGNRCPEVEALIDLSTVKTVIDSVLQGRAFDRKIFPRPQVLATLPNCDQWKLPNAWHTDLPRLASGRSPGVQLFMFLDRVGPQGGGTLVVAGSHRLLNDGRNLRVKDIRAELSRDPYFQRLFNANEPAGPDLPTAMAGAVGLEVAELTGEPGDAWLMDLRALHSAAPNCSPRPRLMATHRFVPTDVTPEIAAAFGWR